MRIGTSKINFFKKNYDLLPTPVNLMRWKISGNDKYKCGRNRTLKHIFSAFPLVLKERYT